MYISKRFARYFNIIFCFLACLGLYTIDKEQTLNPDNFKVFNTSDSLDVLRMLASFKKSIQTNDLEQLDWLLSENYQDKRTNKNYTKKTLFYSINEYHKVKKIFLTNDYLTITSYDDPFYANCNQLNNISETDIEFYFVGLTFKDGFCEVICSTQQNHAKAVKNNLFIIYLLKNKFNQWKIYETDGLTDLISLHK